MQVLDSKTAGVVVVANMGKTLCGDLKRLVVLLCLANAKILGSVERVCAKHGDRGTGTGYGYGTGNESNK